MASAVSTLEHGYLRAAPISNVERLLHALGCDPEPVFAKAGVAAPDFLDIDASIDYVVACRLLEDCALASGCEHFGLLLGQWFLAHQLGLTWQLAETAPDVDAALGDIQEFLGLHENGGIVMLHTQGPRVFLGHAIVEPGLTETTTAYDLSVAVLCIVMRSLCGSAWSPTEVHLSRKRPEDVRPYAAFFRAPLNFDMPQSQLVFSRRCLAQPLPKASGANHYLMARAARAALNARRSGIALRVRDALRRCLAAGEPTSATAVAEQLGLHERTLNRRLREEGTSYRQVREGVLRTLSLQYLEATQLPVADVAAFLGYGSTAAFDRAFRQWYGASPTQRRH